MTPLRLARNACLAALVGATGSVVINTWRRDNHRAKELLGYTALAGLSGVTIGYAFAAVKRHNVYYHGLFVGGNYFIITGTFLVLRESILNFGKGGRQLFVDQSQDSTVPVLLACQPVSAMFASATAGGSTGLLLSLFLNWRGTLPTALRSVQGVGLAVLGQFIYDRLRIWRLEKTIQYHYPELTGNAPNVEDPQEKLPWTEKVRKLLSSKSYSAELNDNIRTTQIQLELLVEEEKQLLKKLLPDDGGKEEVKDT